MRTFFAFMILIGSVLPVQAAQAESDFHPSRVRLLVHRAQPVSENVELRAHFLPAGDLMQGVSPYVYAGAFYKPWSLEMLATWSFPTDDSGLAVRFMPVWGNIWTWSDVEYQTISNAGYWFSQVDYKFVGWLSAGVEGEGWGTWADLDTWSHGFGPNVVFDLKTMAIDVTVHYRGVEGEWKPELFIRTHIFL